MRLTSLKLSGFKSFAEPTQFQLPGQRVGVVGPNGCGKSNIIDAVRWVLGESKASELRGESMQDVIFNGSGQRKPASRASVELVFDNTLARAGGQWNAFAEIAVRRTLTRDGTSTYYINNQAVRRRDVHDVFLGTGLGPRAYAIIGQGTINRIIESRPEELRLFLEEAAGVSKYKERRRETELRLRDTRDNLTRVEDILRELGLSLEKLERQAEVATRFKTLQDSGTLKLHQLWFLKHREAAQEAERVGQALHDAATALEGRMASLRHTEAQLEEVRQAHYASSDTLMQAQRHLAEVGLQVSRLEERVRFAQTSRERIAQRLAELARLDQQWQDKAQAAQTELATLQAQLTQAQESVAVLDAQIEQQHLDLPDQEARLMQAQATRDAQRAQINSLQQQRQVLAAEQRSLVEREQDLQLQHDRVQAERQQHDDAELERLEESQIALAEAEERWAQAQARVEQATEATQTATQAHQQQQQLSLQESRRHAELGAKLSALRALQEKVQRSGRLQPWLQRRGWQDRVGLWQRLTVVAGWEQALEAVLHERLHALEVDALEPLASLDQDAPPARLALHGPALDGVLSGVSLGGRPGWIRLRDHVRSSGDETVDALLDDWLSGWFTAKTLEQALAWRAQLGAGESIVTPAGHCVGQRAVRFFAPDSEQSGLLQRAQDIQHLERELHAQTLISDEARHRLVRTDEAMQQASQQLAQARREAVAAQSQAHALQIDVTRLSQRLEQSTRRRHQLDGELQALTQRFELLGQRRLDAEAQLEGLAEALVEARAEEVTLDAALQHSQRHLSEVRAGLARTERAAQEVHFTVRSLNERLREQQRVITMAEQQLQHHAQVRTEQATELGQLDDSSTEAQLQEALALRVDAQEGQELLRQAHEALAQQLRQLDEERLRCEHSLQPQRDRISALQLEAQAAQLSCAQFMEQLTQAQVDLGVLAQSVETGAVRLHGLQADIDRTQRDINALGPVNLAALDELSSARERKGFLDQQNADLVSAMTTLEEAIGKIDLETQALLQQTFDTVNTHFGEMFPRLFGGGNARLVMTGDAVLEAGVQVMAQPPGKKNSTIHLLSGGEKALTAIALVFAIFQLNPAPFCLLDEVDAPLDDANTGRYAALVRSMSSQTQFLFISHNKIAMEMAEQLVGVTMQEQGVSRIVAVDMDDAMAMAQPA
ncbi:chromosome segregation protein SMC [Leptothrix ochracea]|uniref:chromosome segregation protein SMC n=1 Tax=Leptothrix ochracea TaxID=735331 RepID=UPI0034E1D592